MHVSSVEQNYECITQKMKENKTSHMRFKKKIKLKIKYRNDQGNFFQKNLKLLC